MEYIIIKGMCGWMIRENYDGNRISPIWCYSSLDEALEGLRVLLVPPVIVPAGTQIIP